MMKKKERVEDNGASGGSFLTLTCAVGRGAEKREKTYIASSVLEVCLSTLVVHVRNVRWKFLGVLDEGVVGLLDLLYQPSITRGRQYSVLDHIDGLSLYLSISLVCFNCIPEEARSNHPLRSHSESIAK